MGWSLWTLHSRNTLEQRNIEPKVVVVPPCITLAIRKPQEDSHTFPRPKIHAGIDFRGPKDLKVKAWLRTDLWHGIITRR